MVILLRLDHLFTAGMMNMRHNTNILFNVFNVWYMAHSFAICRAIVFKTLIKYKTRLTFIPFFDYKYETDLCKSLNFQNYFKFDCLDQKGKVYAYNKAHFVIFKILSLRSFLFLGFPLETFDPWKP